MASSLGAPRTAHPNPVLELFSFLKGAVSAVLDFGNPDSHPQIGGGSDGGGSDDRSCVDILRRLLGAGGATELRINALPARLLRVENGVVEDSLEFDQNCCSICLDGYETNNRVKILSCNHCFHAKCIDVWLRKRGVCPMCMREIT